MTGPEIAKALKELEWESRRRRQELLKDYHEKEYYPQIHALQDQCPHEPLDHWHRNGLGHSWQSCRFCGKTLAEAPTEEVGGRLFGEAW